MIKEIYKSKEWYISKLSMFMKESYGITDQIDIYRDWIEDIDTAAVNIFDALNIWDANYKASVYERFGEDGNSEQIPFEFLDKLAALVGTSRVQSIKTEEGYETITLYNGELIDVIKVKIIQNNYQGTTKELIDLYQKVLGWNLYFCTSTSANCDVYLEGVEKDSNLAKLFIYSDLFIEILGISYQKSLIANLANFLMLDESYEDYSSKVSALKLTINIGANDIKLDAEKIWYDGINYYYSDYNKQYVLNIIGGTGQLEPVLSWEPKNWTGTLTSFDGARVWTYNNHIYYSNGWNSQYELIDGQWEVKQWKDINGNDFTDTFYLTGIKICIINNKAYFLNDSEINIKQYILVEDSKWKEVYFKLDNIQINLPATSIFKDEDGVYYSSYAEWVEEDPEGWFNYYNYRLDVSDSENIKLYKKEWNSTLDEFEGYNIWNNGEKVYYSSGPKQKELSKDFSVTSWKYIRDNNFYNFYFLAKDIWIANDTIYCSDSFGSGKQYVFDKTLNAWKPKTWTYNDGSNFALNGDAIWTDGTNYYRSQGSAQSVIDLENGEVNPKSWEGTGLENFNAVFIWKVGNRIFYSEHGWQKDYEKEYTNGNWIDVVWKDKDTAETIKLSGSRIWSDGTNTYYSSGSTHYKIDVANFECESISFTGVSSFDGSEIWNYNGNTYLSEYENYIGTQYILVNQEWVLKEFSYNNFSASYIWNYENNCYISGNSIQYSMESNWIDKEWIFPEDINYESLYASRIVSMKTDSDPDKEVYYYLNPYTSDKLKLKSDNKTWEDAVFISPINIVGENVWNINDNYYFSEGNNQFKFHEDLTAEQISWQRLSSFDGKNVWKYHDEVYYSYNNEHYILGSEENRIWENKVWDTEVSLIGENIWIYDDTAYYSYNGTNLYLNGNKWETKSWTGIGNFNGKDIWELNDELYCINSQNKYFKLKNNVWTEIVWTKEVGLRGELIWTDGTNYYYSEAENQAQYLIDYENLTCQKITWTHNGTAVYMNGENIWNANSLTYYSNGTTHYIINSDDNTLDNIQFEGLQDFYGKKVWSENNTIYYCDGTEKQYKLSGYNWNVAYQRKNSDDTLLNLDGSKIWNSSNGAFYSNGDYQYRRLPNGKWAEVVWTGAKIINGENVWNDGTKYYYSDGEHNYSIDINSYVLSEVTFPNKNNIEGKHIYKFKGSITRVYYFNYEGLFIETFKYQKEIEDGNFLLEYVSLEDNSSTITFSAEEVFPLNSTDVLVIKEDTQSGTKICYRMIREEDKNILVTIETQDIDNINSRESLANINGKYYSLYESDQYELQYVSGEGYAIYPEDYIEDDKDPTNIILA